MNSHKTTFDFSFDSNIKNIENLIPIDSDLLNELKKTRRVIVNPKKIEKLKLKETHGSYLRHFQINLEESENFDKIYPIYKKQINEQFPDVVYVSLKKNAIELSYKRNTNVVDFILLVKQHFKKFLEDYYPYTERCVEDFGPDFLSYIQINKQRLSETYLISITIDENTVTLKGPEKCVNRFIDFKNSLVCQSVQFRDLKLAQDFMVNKFKQLFELSVGINEEKSTMKFCGPVDDVDEAIGLYERYIKSTENPVLLTKMSNHIAENMLLKNEKFYQCYKKNIKKFLNGFIDIKKEDDNTISVLTLREPDLHEDEQRKKINQNLHDCVTKTFKIVLIRPLFEDSYLDLALQKSFLKEVKELLKSGLKISNDDVYLCELTVDRLQYREYLPGTYYVLQNIRKLCFSLDKFDLYNIIKIQVPLQQRTCRLLTRCKDFIRLLENYRKMSAENEIIIGDAQYDLTGRLVDVGYIIAWLKYFVKFKKCDGKLIVPVQMNLNEYTGLIERIIKSVGIDDEYYFFIENNRILNFSGIDAEKRNKYQQKIKETLLNYACVVKTINSYLIDYLKEFYERIQNDFPSIQIEILNNTDIRVKGNRDLVDFFIEDFELIIFVEFNTRDFFNFYKNIEFNVTGVRIQETKDGCVISGRRVLVEHIISISRLFDDFQRVVDIKLDFQDRKYKRLCVNRFLSTEIKILFELDNYSVDLFRKIYRSQHPNSILDLSYVSEDLYVYEEAAADEDDNVDKMFNRFEDLYEGYEEHNQILGLEKVIMDNIIVYKKLIDKLTDLRYSLEFEWNIKFPLRIEMVRYDEVKITGAELVIEEFERILMKKVEDLQINFETKYFINSTYLKRLIKLSEGQTWKLSVKNECVVFSGQYIYYLFFNILFEQYLLAIFNYTLQSCVIRIRKFGEYAKVFQRSRKLFDEFKQSLPDDLKDCRCEMQAFQDGLIIEPSLELATIPTSVNLDERYNKAFNDFVEKRLEKRAVGIIYGDVLLKYTEINITRIFITILNSEIRRFDRKLFEPLLVFAEGLNTTKNAIVIYGLKDDVNFVARKLVQIVVKSLNIRNFPVPDHPMFALFTQLAPNYQVLERSGVYKIVTQFIDYVFLRTFFDISDNGLYMSVNLDHSKAQLRYDPILNDFRREYEIHIRSELEYVINIGKYKFEVSRKSKNPEDLVFLNSKIKDSLRSHQHFVPFDTRSINCVHLKNHFILYFPYIYEWGTNNTNLKIITNTCDITVFNEKWNDNICLEKYLGSSLCLRQMLKITGLDRVLRNLKQELEIKTNQDRCYIKKNDNYHDLKASLYPIDYLNLSGILESMLFKVRVFIYQVESEVYEHFLYKMFPQYILKNDIEAVGIGFEYSKSHMIIYSFENDNEIEQVLKTVDQYLMTRENFSVT